MAPGRPRVDSFDAGLENPASCSPGDSIAVFPYFGYGSNINLTSLRAKGVEPRWSQPATLHG
jgi:hypothetical protein